MYTALLIRNSKAPLPYRPEMVKYAIKHGNKPAARKFQTSTEIVRKWRKRYVEGKLPAITR